MSELFDRLNKHADECERGVDITGPDVGGDIREAVAHIEKLAYIARRLAALKDESKPGMPGYSALAITAERFRLLERVDEIAGKAVED